jgi:tRNA(Arg) A34 adenosine deaminase TadA
MNHACDLSIYSISHGGGPFGAVIVKDGIEIGKGHNRVVPDKDPTQHAEIVAIRDACRNIDSFDLSGSVLYTSCEPCPMCLAAIYWARIETVYYGNTREDAREIGFDDAFIYEELNREMEKRKVKCIQSHRTEAQKAFAWWKEKEDKTEY